MAEDIKLKWNIENQNADYNLLKGDFEREETFETAVLLSLFTDRRASIDDELDDLNDRRGWWGDQLSTNEDEYGSKLWLLYRKSTDQKTLAKVKQYAYDSLQWMLDDEVVAKINIEVERQGSASNGLIALKIAMYQFDGNIIMLRYDDIWRNLNAI